ncbi:MAG: hypothetical protein IKB11_05050, partial [Bacteroidaceae bacterium]|nr:hypothetical protein [Bacteroidaceae bacterium]
RYACLQNPHLRPVNCGFSGCASLKLHLFIHLPEKEAAKKYFLVSLFLLVTGSLFIGLLCCR